MIKELELIRNEIGNVQLKVYYKVTKGIKTYYDFQYMEDDIKLKGSYDVLETSELIYYLEERYNE